MVLCCIQNFLQLPQIIGLYFTYLNLKWYDVFETEKTIKKKFILKFKWYFNYVLNQWYIGNTTIIL